MNQPIILAVTRARYEFLKVVTEIEPQVLGSLHSECLELYRATFEEITDDNEAFRSARHSDCFTGLSDSGHCRYLFRHDPGWPVEDFPYKSWRAFAESVIPERKRLTEAVLKWAGPYHLSMDWILDSAVATLCRAMDAPQAQPLRWATPATWGIQADDLFRGRRLRLHFQQEDEYDPFLNSGRIESLKDSRDRLKARLSAKLEQHMAAVEEWGASVGLWPDDLPCGKYYPECLTWLAVYQVKEYSPRDILAEYVNKQQHDFEKPQRIQQIFEQTSRYIGLILLCYKSLSPLRMWREPVIVEEMGVVQAKIQTVEDIYRLVRAAVIGKRPICATYHGRDRWFCPHRLGRNHQGQIRVLCYQYAGESDSGLQAAGSPANWRCIALEKLIRVELLEGAWHTAPNHSRPQTCVAEVDVDAED